MSIDNRRAELEARSVPLTAPPLAPSFDTGDCYGIVGDYVRLWAPHTEAAPVAIYASALAACGALVGRGPSWHFGNCSHHARFYLLLIGVSGAGRKGTGMNVGAKQLLAAVDPDFLKTRVVSGLSSAEGLIAEIRDPAPPRTDAKGNSMPGDPGVSDKRLLVLEGEIGGALEAMTREGNRLSAILRDAWDGNDIRSLVKREPQAATAPHITLIGAITPAELRKVLSHTSVLNGFANRILPIWATRSQLLPEDSLPEARSLERVTRDLASSVERARAVGHVEWTPNAKEQWAAEYSRLAVVEDASNDIRALLERGAPYVRRAALLLALLDGTGAVDAAHLNAALALWRYSADTWRMVYHDGAKRSPLADKLLAALLDAGESGLTRTAIREDVVRSNDVPAEHITAALGELASTGLAHRTAAPTAGRPAEHWRHARYVARSGGKGAKGDSDVAIISTNDISPISPISPFPPPLGLFASPAVERIAPNCTEPVPTVRVTWLGGHVSTLAENDRDLTELASHIERVEPIPSPDTNHD